METEIVVGSAVRLSDLISFGARHSLKLNTTYVVTGISTIGYITSYTLYRQGKYAGTCTKRDGLFLF